MAACSSASNMIRTLDQINRQHDALLFKALFKTFANIWALYEMQMRMLLVNRIPQLQSFAYAFLSALIMHATSPYLIYCTSQVLSHENKSHLVSMEVHATNAFDFLFCFY